MLDYLLASLMFFGCFQASGQDPSDDLHKTIPQRLTEKNGDLQMAITVDGPRTRTLEELTSRSTIVVQGRVIGKETVLVGERALWTDFRIRVLDILRSTLAVDFPTEVTVSILGGKMKFPEGTVTFENTDFPLDRMPVIGQEYVLFLTTNDILPGKYTLVDGSQAAFDVTLGKVEPVAEKNPGKLYVDTFGLEANAFKKRIRELSEKH